MSSTTSTYFCVLTIRKQLPEMRFERSGRVQEPSRGHKFFILENFLSIRDFTSQTLASFPSDLVGVALVVLLPIQRPSQSTLLPNRRSSDLNPSLRCVGGIFLFREAVP